LKKAVTKNQTDWRKCLDWTFPWKGINDPKYIEDRSKSFIKSGNGWWWGWTKLNTPIPGVYSAKDDKRVGGDRGPKKVGRPPKEDFDDPKNK